jgi:hypothetical protein
VNAATLGFPLRIFRIFRVFFPRLLRSVLFFSLPVILLPQPPRYSCAVTQISPQSRTLAVRCEAALSDGRVEIVFRDRYAGLSGLGERISSLEVLGASGAASPLVFTYRVNLAAPIEPGGYALASSLGPEAAVLYAADLFPVLQVPDGVSVSVTRISVEPPEGWTMAEAAGGDAVDADNAVYVLGRLREHSFAIENMRWRVVAAGDLSVEDAELHRLAEAIARAQAGMIGGSETGDHLVAVAPFPLPLTGLRSTGLARGRTIALLVNPGDDPIRTRTHLARHMAHEMFHVYLPNAFVISENFDWFWEGFTRYAALLTLLDAREIAFQDYLDALQSEFDAYGTNPLRAQASLVSASPEKFSSAAHYEIVYRKGMIVGALYDLELRRQTRARRRLPDVMKALYREYAMTGRAAGNRDVLDALGKEGDFTRFIEDYIEGVREIDFARDLNAYGIDADRSFGRGRPGLQVSSRLNAAKRGILDSFGGRSGALR